MSRKKKAEVIIPDPPKLDPEVAAAIADADPPTMTIALAPSQSFDFQSCRVCGTRRLPSVTEGNVIRWPDACPVDGTRYEEPAE